MVLLSVRDNEVIRFLSKVARVPETQLLARSIARNAVSVALEVPYELFEGTGILDAPRVYQRKVLDGCIDISISQQRQHLFEHFVARMTIVHRTTQLLLTLPPG